MRRLPHDERSDNAPHYVLPAGPVFMFDGRTSGTLCACHAMRYLDCGRRDEYALDVGARVAAARMREMGLDVRHEEFDDDHRNVGYRYDVSLPALAGVLERA